jgi:hypothetical protein
MNDSDPDVIFSLLGRSFLSKSMAVVLRSRDIECTLLTSLSIQCTPLKRI